MVEAVSLYGVDAEEKNVASIQFLYSQNA